MTDAKIEVQIGNFYFSGEDDSDWLATQLDKILDRIEQLVNLLPLEVTQPPFVQEQDSSAPVGNDDIANKTLITFLKEKNATNNQVEKFLATAAWLEAKGQKRLSTTDVTTSLRNASQSRLTNASDCLNKNISKGYCEKEGSQFFLTQEGKEHLGIA